LGKKSFLLKLRKARKLLTKSRPGWKEGGTGKKRTRRAEAREQASESDAMIIGVTTGLEPNPRAPTVTGDRTNVQTSRIQRGVKVRDHG